MALIPRTSTAIHEKDTPVAYYVPESYHEKTDTKIPERIVMGKVFAYDEARNTYDVRIESWQLISVPADNCYDPENDPMEEIPKVDFQDDPAPWKEIKPLEIEPRKALRIMAKTVTAFLLLLAIVYGVRWVNGLKPHENAPTGLNEAVETLNQKNLEDVPLLNERSELNSEIERATKRKTDVEELLRKNKADKDAALKIINSFRK